MRLTLYASFLIISCALIQTTLADSRNYKRSIKDEDNGSVERPSKDKRVKKSNSKYRTDVSDTSEEDYKINKRINRKPWEEDHDFTREKKYSKYTKKTNKFADDSEEESVPTRKNKRSFDGRNDQDKQGSGKNFGKKKTLVTDKDSDEDSDEDSAESKERLVKKDGKKYSKFEEKTSAEKNTKTKKFPSKRVKDDDDNDDDDDDSDEETVKFEKKFARKTKMPTDDSDEVEEEPKKKFRKKIRVRVPDSPEDDSDESEEDACQRSRKGKGQKSCPAKESANGNDDTTEEPVRPKKIKYSIKFAHEKERSVPAEDSNIMLKIHRGDKKKYRYQDDDDDDSSEENRFPKRIRFLDDDDE